MVIDDTTRLIVTGIINGDSFVKVAARLGISKSAITDIFYGAIEQQFPIIWKDQLEGDRPSVFGLRRHKNRILEEMGTKSREQRDLDIAVAKALLEANGYVVTPNTAPPLNESAAM